MKEYSMKFSLVTFFIFVFLASFFFDDSFTYLLRRIIYSVFLYLSIWELYLFYSEKLKIKTTSKNVSPFKIYYYCLLVLIFINLIRDFFNPAFNFVTLFNNPYALAMVLPLFALEIGYFTKNVNEVYKLFLWISILFLLNFILPIRPDIKFTEGNVCGYIILPFFIFCYNKKKHLAYSIFLLFALILFSFYSDIRLIFLRVILFFCLFVSFSLVKKLSIAKILVFLFFAFIIFEAFTNMEFYLNLFARELHVKQFNPEDTRTFLYTELFDDFHLREYFVGRGFLGSYFSEYFLFLQKGGNSTGDFYYRFTVEVGFLEAILKGGSFLFLLYLLPLLYASIRGIFFGHNNRLIFMLSIFVLNEIYLMFFENITFYNLNYFILFFISGFIIKSTKNIPFKTKNKLMPLTYKKIDMALVSKLFIP